jgi:hypothetical protein
MSGSVAILYPAGAFALMMFATRMVRTGVERAYGDVLRYTLRTTMHPVMAVLGDRIDRRHAAVKIYLAKVTSRPVRAAILHLVTECPHILGCDFGQQPIAKRREGRRITPTRWCRGASR